MCRNVQDLKIKQTAKIKIKKMTAKLQCSPLPASWGQRMNTKLQRSPLSNDRCFLMTDATWPGISSFYLHGIPPWLIHPHPRALFIFLTVFRSAKLSKYWALPFSQCHHCRGRRAVSFSLRNPLEPDPQGHRVLLHQWYPPAKQTGRAVSRFRL